MPEKYSIGGVVLDTDTSEAFGDIPQNRVLMAEKLTAFPAATPQIVKDLTNIDQVFAHFKPNIDVKFENEQGEKKETLRFNNLGDFGIKGITAQSDFINDLSTKKEQYQQIIKQLKSNKILQEVLKNDDTKLAFIEGMQALIKELDMAPKPVI